MSASATGEFLRSIALPDATTVTAIKPLFGSATSNLYRLDTSSGAAFFAKTTPSSAPRTFEQEALGLRVLGDDGGLPVPAIVAHGTVEGQQYVLMPFIERFRAVGGGARRQEAEAGRRLAELHRHTSRDGRFGAMVPRALLGEAPSTADGDDGDESAEGGGAQGLHAHYDDLLTWTDDWPSTYLDTMIAPQVARAKRHGLWSGRRERDLATFSERFRLHFSQAADDEAGTSEARLPTASLLHGDLWGGNLLFDQSGAPWFIDPMPLYGDREVDLAMTELFGGFGDAFYKAYEGVYPLREGAAQRVPWYQLYYLLLHLNLFGEAYGGAVESALRAI